MMTSFPRRGHRLTLLLLMFAAMGMQRAESDDEQIRRLARECQDGNDDSCKTLVGRGHIEDAYKLAEVGSTALIRRLAAAAPEGRDAVMLLRVGTGRFPNDAPLHYEMAKAILRTGLNVAPTNLEAYGPLLRAVQLRPNFVEALRALGSIEAATGHSELAVERFRAALRERPELVGTRIDLGQTLLRLRHPREAAEEFRSALRQPSLPTIERDVARAGLAETSFWLGDGHRALSTDHDDKQETVPGPGVACIKAVTLWWLARDDESRRACELTLEGPLYCNCHGRSSATPGSLPTAMTPDERNVVLAALSTNLDLDLADDTQTIVEGTSAFSEVKLADVAKLRGPFMSLTQQYDDQSRVAEAVNDLLSRSRNPAIVALPHDKSSRVTVLSRAQMQRLVTQETAFYERFPKARGFMTVSRPGWSRDHHVAAVAVQWNEGLWNGPVHLFVLDGQEQSWRLRIGADTRRR